MIYWISALLLVGGAGVWLQVSRRRRLRDAARRRRVELPNSHYSAPGVRRSEDLEHWTGIPVERLHPVNREEVQRLLRLVDAAGPDVLSPKDRLFLDVMMEPRTD